MPLLRSLCATKFSDLKTDEAPFFLGKNGLDFLKKSVGQRRITQESGAKTVFQNSPSVSFTRQIPQLLIGSVVPFPFQWRMSVVI
jgi:hypothetical protein